LTTTAVIQSKPGIGDVIWHLPFIKAIAAASPGASVTFLAPPSSCAGEILQAEDCISRVLYYENHGSEIMRGVRLMRLVALLRRERFETIWILDRTARPAFASWLAGIPRRFGLGLGRQSLFISNNGIDPRHRHDMPIAWLVELMRVMGVPLPNTEPNLRLPPRLPSELEKRYQACSRPWIVVGVGGSHPTKVWPTELMREFLVRLRAGGRGTVFLIGGNRLAPLAEALMAAGEGAQAINACDLSVVQAAALLQLADLYVGPDSGPMNLAAAVGTPAVGLFGSTPVLRYSRFIHAVTPDDGGGPTPDGMRRISPQRVLETIRSLGMLDA
jgi:heptosyltransferase-2